MSDSTKKPEIDAAKAEAFARSLLSALNNGALCLLIAVGHRVGLFDAMRELPPDVEAGWLDAQGDLRLAPDIARKLRTARRVRQLLQELRQRDREC